MKKITGMVIMSIILVGCSGRRLVTHYHTNQMDILYVGIEQSVFLQVKSKNYRVSTNVGTVEKIDSNHYLVYPDTIPGKLILTVSKGNRKEEITFRVKPIPEINIYVSADTNIYAPSVTAENFRTFRYLAPRVTNLDANCYIELSSYKITRISNHVIIDSVSVSSSIKSKSRVTDIAKSVVPGDVLLLEDIFVKISTIGRDYKSYWRQLDDKIYYIK